MEGFEEGANAGAKREALAGMFFGLLGAAGGMLGLGIGSATKLGMTIKGTAAVAVFTGGMASTMLRGESGTSTKITNNLGKEKLKPS